MGNDAVTVARIQKMSPHVCHAYSIEASYLMLCYPVLSFRRMWVVPVAVSPPELAISAVNEQLGVLIAADLSALLNGVLLCIKMPRDPAAPALPDVPPAIWIGYHMMRFALCHLGFLSTSVSMSSASALLLSEMESRVSKLSHPQKATSGTSTVHVGSLFTFSDRNVAIRVPKCVRCLRKRSAFYLSSESTRCCAPRKVIRYV